VEELGVNFGHIKMKARSIHGVDSSGHADTDTDSGGLESFRQDEPRHYGRQRRSWPNPVLPCLRHIVVGA
jgi:hypothetical protein